MDWQRKLRYLVGEPSRPMSGAQRHLATLHGAGASFPLPYSKSVETIRQEEYPHMSNGIYLDHSGATIYARSTVDRFAEKMKTSLLGNPHSANEPAKVSGEIVDSVRAKALSFLGADPRYFDLIFVANTTAGIKLVADCFRDLAEKTKARSFWYGYHRDSHTSLVGVRELTNGMQTCFETDAEVDDWLESPHETQLGRHHPSRLGLFAYPGQSNLNGRRLPLNWMRDLRQSHHLQNTYSLFDAASLAMTSPMSRVFEDPLGAPDFTTVSFYKIFGFPDLGGLIVRKDSGHILSLRKYFGGGTVTMVSAIGGAWHKSKGLETKTDDIQGYGPTAQKYEIHDGVEDGTLPFHNILALGEAIDVHQSLYGPMENIAQHTGQLARRLYLGMSSLQHINGQPLCRMYNDDCDAFGDPIRQGATVAFNVLRPDGTYVPYSDVEKMANEQSIYVRSGGICCPGGLFTALQYEPWELERAKSAGHHCGSVGRSLIHQLPTGVVRASVGAMSTAKEIDMFVTFLNDTFIPEGRERHSQHIITRKHADGLPTGTHQQVAVSCAA